MTITRSELLRSGWSISDVRHSVGRGELVRLCKGVYVTRDEAPTDAEQRHMLRAVAFAQRSEYVVSHASAALLHRLPVGGADLGEVHMTRTGRGGHRHEAGRRVHSGQLPPEMLTTVADIPVTTVARTLVDLAKFERLEVAVAAADNALHDRRCDTAEIDDAMYALRGHPYSRRSGHAMALVDGRAESPGETRSRLLLNAGARRAGLVLPTTDVQINVFDEAGRFVGRADGGYPDLGVLWEYDGMSKYSRLLKPGQSALDVILAEKRREERLTELGWVVIRIIAEDLRHPEELLERVASAMARSRRPGWLPPRGTYRVLDPVT